MAKRIHISRRTFLDHCAAIAAATGLPAWFVERELSAAGQTGAGERRTIGRESR